jgi:hypothetical protein
MLESADLLVEHIHAERAALVAQTTQRLRAEVPWFQRLPVEGVRVLVEEDIGTLDHLLTMPDARTARNLVAEAGLLRLRSGAPATDLIAAASLLGEEIEALILQAFTDPVAANAASRRLQSATRNIRMILSGVNLQMLMVTDTSSAVSTFPY